MNTAVHSNSNPKRSRILALDAWRGVAILLMAIFHFCFDLSLYHYIEFSFDAPFWFSFRVIILALFFNLIGIGLVLSHSSGIVWRSFLTRWIKLVGAALIISIATLWYYPSSWIYFGVLHFIALASLLALPLIRYPIFSLVLGLLIFPLHYLTSWLNVTPIYTALQPLLHLPSATQDVTRFIPWFGFILTGIFLGHKGLDWIRFPSNKLGQGFAFAGRHALLIYLIHQPILLGLVMLYNHLTNL